MINLKGIVTDITTHWNYPAKKKNIAYKEMAAYSVGGIGVQFIVAMIGLVTLSAQSMLVGAAIGIRVVDLQSMAVISTILSFAIAPLRGMIYDNTRSKMGKFRPHLLWSGIPTAVLMILLVYLPYDHMEYFTKVVAVLLIQVALCVIVAPFYTTSYNSLVQVLSPNSEERTWVIEISSVIFSLAPSITGFAIPLMGPLDKMSTYKLAVPIFCVLGVVLGFMAVTGTKERIIVSKKYVPRVRFWDGLSKISRNKYFWIINGSSWIGFLNIGFGLLFPWIFYYGMQNAPLYAVLTTVLGTASLPGMLFAAPLINKFGKKQVALVSCYIQIAATAAMLLCYKNYVLMFILIYLKTLGGAVGVVNTPAMKADMMDYQQYRTGDRMEGSIDQIGGLIGSLLALGTGYALPLIQQKLGLTNNFDDLYKADFRNPLVLAMIVCSIVGTALSLLPLFFYDLSEKKHRNMIKVLKVRALFEDYSNGELSPEALVDTLEDLHEAQQIVAQGSAPADKKQAAVYEAAKLVLDELHKFETPEMQEEVEQARTLVAQGPVAASRYEDKFENGVHEPSPDTLKKAIDLPEETNAQKKIRKAAIRAAEDEIHLFNKACKPYVAAKKLVHQYEAYQKFPQIEEQFEEACRTVEANERAKKQQREQEAQEKKAEKMHK